MSRSDPRETCGHCRYFDTMIGLPQLCRRHPPSAEGDWPGWPETGPADWCGEFAPIMVPDRKEAEDGGRDD